MKDIGETLIHIDAYAVKIIVNDRIIDNNDLDWKDGSLSLNEISKQLDTCQIVYVWIENGLSGTIYQFNNYADGMWCEHGRTKGYA